MLARYAFKQSGYMVPLTTSKLIHGICQNFPDLKCTCKGGFVPTFLPAPILSSRPPKLILCSADPYRIDFTAMDQNNSNIMGKTSVVEAAGKGENGKGIQFYPGEFSVVFKIKITNKVISLIVLEDGELNHWMLAMIGIGLIFIAFVGVSIYLMW